MGKTRKPVFGDIILNPWAGPSNPDRVGVFVRTRGKEIELTDTKGKFWEISRRAFRCPWSGDPLEGVLMEPWRVVGSIHDVNIGSAREIIENLRNAWADAQPQRAT